MTATNDEEVQEIMAQLAAARLQIELMAKQIELMGNEIEQYKGMHRGALDRLEKWMYKASDLLNEKAEALNAQQAIDTTENVQPGDVSLVDAKELDISQLAPIIHKNIQGVRAPRWSELAPIERDMFTDSIRAAMREYPMSRLWEGTEWRPRPSQAELQNALSENNKMMWDVLSGSKLSGR